MSYNIQQNISDFLRVCIFDLYCRHDQKNGRVEAKQNNLDPQEKFPLEGSPLPTPLKKF